MFPLIRSHVLNEAVDSICFCSIWCVAVIYQNINTVVLLMYMLYCSVLFILADDIIQSELYCIILYILFLSKCNPLGSYPWLSRCYRHALTPEPHERHKKQFVCTLQSIILLISAGKVMNIHYCCAIFAVAFTEEDFEGFLMFISSTLKCLRIETPVRVGLVRSSVYARVKAVLLVSSLSALT